MPVHPATCLEFGMTFFRRITVIMLGLSLVFSGMAHAAPSALIGTEQLARSLAPSDSRTRLLATLDRPELVAALQTRGVSADEVRARVDALTDEEAVQLMAQVDQAPAGAGVVGVLVGLFIILLITDILGLTKVFPFTRPVR